MHWADVVLHIDSDTEFSSTLTTRLKPAGIQVHSLHEASQWKETIQKLDAGIILLDVESERFDGLDILEQIRKLEGDRRVIILTDQLSTSTVVAAMAQGVDFCFLKSEFESQELLDAIHALQFRRFHWCRVARLAGDLRHAQREADEIATRKKAAAAPAKPAALPINAALTEAFPRFLLQTGRVSSEALVKAVEYCDRQRPLLGQIGLELGKLEVKHIFRIVEDQAVSREPFGKVAVRLGILSPDEVETLLEAQRTRRPDVGAALVTIGAITQDKLDQFLDDFRDYVSTLPADNGTNASAEMMISV